MENKIATTIEQSKKLLELGIDADTADMYWEYDSFQGFHRLELFEDGFPKNLNKNDIPAWSLAALIEQLDETITTDDGDFNLHILVENGGYYVQYDDNYEGKIFVESGFQENIVDAVFEVIVKTGIGYDKRKQEEQGK